MSELIALVIWVIVFYFVGLMFGTDMGAEKACESVKMEWVNDKCMKVTREEVK